MSARMSTESVVAVERSLLPDSIAPKDWNVEDVTSPHDCLYHYEYSDAEPDLTLKFDRRSISCALVEVDNGI